MTLDVNAVERQLWPHGPDRDVWMILDGAKDRRIHSDLVNSHLEYSCLYSGDLPYNLEAASPQLVQLVFEDTETRDLIGRAWGNSWGVFVRSGTTMQRLRRHLRTLLLVDDWKGRRLLFRYYDPRVLRTYLPTCTSEELNIVFGPATHFWTETETRDLRQFRLDRGGLSRTDHSVVALGSTQS